MQALLVQRMRIATYLSLGSFGLFLINDIVSHHPHLATLIAIKLVQVIAAVAVLVMLRDERTSRYALPIALATTLFFAGAATLSAILRGNANGHLLLLVAVVIGTATLYPWGVRAQAILVVTCFALLCLTFHAVDGSALTLLTNPSFAALITALFFSVYIASDIDSYRLQIAKHEHDLQLREEHFGSLIENASELIVVIGVDSVIRSVSASVQHLLGYAPRDWIGTSLFALVDEEDVPNLRAVVASSASSAPIPLSIEVRVRDAAGSSHVLLCTVTNLLANAAVEGIVFNARDITSRKEMETELRRSEAALSALIENSSDAVWSVDRERRLTTLNAALRELFMQIFHFEVRVGQSFEERAPAEIAAAWRAFYDRALAGERVTREVSFPIDEVLHHYLVSFSPIREGDEITGAVVFSRDITEVRETAELARRNQADLTHVLRLGTMGEVASGLAHEINQPLGAIANYAAACSRSLEGTGPTPDLRRGLELIAAEALRAGEIIRRLRDLARKGQESMQMVDLNTLVRSAVTLMEPEARLQSIAVRVDTDSDLPRVFVDPIQIEQVVLNLILNAIESMHLSADKLLSVSTGRVDGHVHVAIRDTGTGLDAAHVERAFAPFFTTKAKGLGMGLAISRRIVEAHGGHLTGSANEQGQGSTFSFELPLPR